MILVLVRQSILENFTPSFRVDIAEYRGGLMLYGREDTAFKSLPNVNTFENIDNIFAIVNLRVKSLPT